MPDLEPPAGAVAAGCEELDALLRRCVQCGLCLPACGTWLVTGDETMSPRGRLLLLGEWLAEPGLMDTEPSWRRAFTTCIGCQACSGVCPSGVPFDLLAGAVEAARRPAPGSAPGGGDRLVARLDGPRRLRLLAAAAGVGRVLVRLVRGARRGPPPDRQRSAGPAGVWYRVARAVGTVPRAPAGDKALLRLLDGLAGVAPTRGGDLPPSGRAGVRLLWFAGCANEGLLPDSSRRLRAVLRWAGATLVEAPGAGCCGALAAHGGLPARALTLRERNLAAWGHGRGAAAVVTEAAGCGVALRGYGDRLPVPQVDAIAWLAGAARPDFGAVPLRVALHDPCHARHGQGLVREPRALLRAIPGLVLLEPAEPDVCCGSGGLWSLAQPELSEQLGRRKAALLAATGADLVVTSNPGCLGQIAEGLACLPGRKPALLPLGDLLWYAARRARP